nr:RNA-directed DNA polymerase, eukaryota [Tanacetum cinerariifolium]
MFYYLTDLLEGKQSLSVRGFDNAQFIHAFICAINLYVVRAKEVTGWVPNFGEENSDESEDYSDNNSIGKKNWVESEEGEIISESVQNDAFIDNIAESEPINGDSRENQSDHYEYEKVEALRESTTPEDSKKVRNDQTFHQVLEESVNKSSGVSKTAHTESMAGPVKQRNGFSILERFQEFIDIGQAMGYKMKGCEKDFRRIITSLGDVDTSARGRSGDILCVWDKLLFHKRRTYATKHYLCVEGTWMANNVDLLFIFVYSPQELSLKRVLWNYMLETFNRWHGEWVKKLCHSNHVNFLSIEETKMVSLVLWNYMLETFNRWHGEVIIMGDFNEVRFTSKRHGSYFHSLNTAEFNMFIANSKLIDIPLGGYSFTWSDKHASKMSKLDRFLVYQGMLDLFPNLTGLILHRHFFDHRLILLKETHVDYDPTPFCLYHSWLLEDDFHSVIEDSWNNDGISASNSMILLKNKLKFLKQRLKEWSNIKRRNKDHDRKVIQDSLIEIDLLLDKGNGLPDDLTKRAVEGDENSKNFHGIVNKKRRHLAIKGLKVNVHKSSIYGVGVRQADVQHMAENFGCISNNLPFTYLGVKVGANMMRLNSWSDVVKKVLNKLSNWKAKTLSVGVIKSIHGNSGALDNPYSSRLKNSTWIGILKAITKLKVKGVDLMGFCKIVIGNGSTTRFWHDVWYGDICFKVKFKRVFNLELQKDANVASKLKASNVASSFRRPPRSSIESSQFIELGQILSSISLSSVSERCLLCKWKWRFLTEENALWRRVISSFYGPDGGFSGLLNDGRKHSVWGDILRSLVYIENLNSSFGFMFFKKNSSDGNLSVDVLAWKISMDRLPTRVNLHRRGVQTSNGDGFQKTHDELDFEFLGNIKGKPWRFQTNLYGNGSTSRGREERYTLWFDPTKAYHRYTILWTSSKIMYPIPPPECVIDPLLRQQFKETGRPKFRRRHHRHSKKASQVLSSHMSNVMRWFSRRDSEFILRGGDGGGGGWKRLRGGDGGGGGLWRGKLGPLVAKSGKDLDRDGERRFDYLTIALVSLKASAKGVGLRGEDPIRARTGNLRAREGTIFDAPPGYVGLSTHSFRLANLRLHLTEFFYEPMVVSPLSTSSEDSLTCVELSISYKCSCVYRPILFLAGFKPSWEHEMAVRNFIYTEDDNDLDFLPKEPSPGFGIGFPSASVNTKPPKDVEEPEVQPVEVIADSGESPKAGVFVVHPGSVAARDKERKCRTREGSLRPLIKRKLASRPSSSRAMRAKTFASQDDASFLSISDNDEGLSDCFELKDANACHLKISAITLPTWKGHLDNQMNLELLDLHDRCYTWQAVVDNVVNRRAREFLQNPTILALREKISSLTADVTEHKEANKARLEAIEVSLRREVKELKQDRRDVVSKVVPYATIELVHSDELGRLVGKLVSSAITYRRCRAYEQVAVMKESFELSKAKG